MSLRVSVRTRIRRQVGEDHSNAVPKNIYSCKVQILTRCIYDDASGGKGRHREGQVTGVRVKTYGKHLWVQIPPT